VLAEHLEHVRQERYPPAEQHQPEPIELADRGRAVVRHEPMHQNEPDEANRQVHEKDHAPMSEPYDQPTRQWS
jgi:hypothetical protein